MPEEGYDTISLRTETKTELVRRKLNKQAKNGRNITWDDFLLEATKNNNQEAQRASPKTNPLDIIPPDQEK